MGQEGDVFPFGNRQCRFGTELGTPVTVGKRAKILCGQQDLHGESDRGGSATFCPGFALERCAAVRSLGVESAQWQR